MQATVKTGPAIANVTAKTFITFQQNEEQSRTTQHPERSVCERKSAPRPWPCALHEAKTPTQSH